MQLSDLQKQIKSKRGTTEETPFGPDALVYKVAGKMFALIAWEERPLRITLKCDPDEAVTLRNSYISVQPGYHMNKEHWNTIVLDDRLSDEMFQYLLDESYRLVVSGLKKGDRVRLAVDLQ